MSEGWVYVFSNKHMPGLVKIGQTSNDPIRRARELESTGVPGRFEVEYQGLFEGYARIERSVHSALAEYREYSNREFFRIDVARAILAIREASIHPPKREVSKQDRLRQAEQAKRQAEKEERQRQEKKRLDDAAYAQAKEKMIEYNENQSSLIEDYVQKNYFDFWPLINVFGGIAALIGFIFNPFIGILAVAATYLIGKIVEDSQREPFRIEGEKKFPNKCIEDFIKNPIPKGGWHDTKPSDSAEKHTEKHTEKQSHGSEPIKKTSIQTREKVQLNCSSRSQEIRLHNVPLFKQIRIKCPKCYLSFERYITPTAVYAVDASSKLGDML